jgi:transketolase
MPDLIAKAKWVRQQLFEMITRTQRGPIPSTFSMVEILVALYYVVKKPDERVIISKGHAGIAVYPILADLGLLEPNELDTFAQPGSRLCMYAEPRVPQITVPCASLGIGFGVAAGLAFADRTQRVFCILGDSECYEGSIWETAMWAAHHKLTNLIVILDRNGHGVMDETEKCVAQEPVDHKWMAFGFEVVTCHGHNAAELANVLAAKGQLGPRMVIAKTVKAKGVSFWEGKPNVHSAVMTKEEVVRARAELS